MVTKYSLLRILTINTVKYNLKFTPTKVEVEKMLAILDLTTVHFVNGLDPKSLAHTRTIIWTYFK